MTAGVNGTTGGSASGVNTHTATSVTAAAAAHYHFAGWTVTSGSATIADAGAASTTVQLTGAHGSSATVAAAFAIDTCTVTFVEGANGSITGTRMQTINYGADCSAVTAVPQAGYHFVSWSGGYAGTANPLTVAAVTADITITANFAINSYTVTFTAGTGGAVTGTATQGVTHGGSCSPMTAVAEAAYRFVNWSGTGGFATATSNPLTVSNVTSDMTITATFAAKTAQAITFNALPAKSILDGDFDPGASSSSGLAISYASSNTGVATIVSGKIHVVGLGTSTVTASQAGDGTYNAANDVQQLLTVGKATATVTLGNLAQVYDGFAKSVSATTSPTGLTVNLTYDGAAAAPTNAGSYAVVGTINDATYQGSASGTLVIAKASQTITFAALPAKKVGDADFDPGASSSCGLAIAYASSDAAVATIAAGRIHLVGAGTTTITASQAGDANHSAATDFLRTLTVKPITYTVTFVAGANGAIAGATTQTVESGKACSAVTAVPDAHHHFVSWSEGQPPMTFPLTDNPLVVAEVVRDMSFTANFAVDTSVIAATAGPGGKIDPSGEVVVDYGASKSFTIAADEGYKLQACLVDGAAVSVDKSYTFTNVTAAHAISVAFMQSSVVLTMAASGDGTGHTMPAAGSALVIAGMPVAVIAAPDRGCFFGGWTVSDGAVVANGNAKSTAVTLVADATVTALFAKTPPQRMALLMLAADPVEGGSVSIVSVSR